VLPLGALSSKTRVQLSHTTCHVFFTNFCNSNSPKLAEWLHKFFYYNLNSNFVKSKIATIHKPDATFNNQMHHTSKGENSHMFKIKKNQYNQSKDNQASDYSHMASKLKHTIATKATVKNPLKKNTAEETMLLPGLSAPSHPLLLLMGIAVTSGDSA
jgi:hypothetical protein